MIEAIDPAVIANTARMLRSADPFRAICLVEGDDDSKFYKGVFDTRRCAIVACHGFPRTIEVLSRLTSQGFPGLLAIVDSDFARMEGRAPTGNVMWTDTHDLETDLIRSRAFDKVVSDLCDEARMLDFCESGDLRSQLLASAAPLAYLRWLNDRQGYGLKFKDIDYGAFIDKHNLTVDAEKMVRTVLNKSQRHDLVARDILSEMDRLMDPSHDALSLCRGHDVVEILSIGLRKRIGNRDAKEVRRELLERNLRVAYERPDFLLTDLYRSLRTWERSNTSFTVLPGDA